MHCKKSKTGLSRLMLSGVASLSMFTLGMSAAKAAILIPTLYDTGVDDSGAPLAAQAVDHHYTITQTPAGNVTQSAFATDPTSFQFPGLWATNTLTSQWISPQAVYGNASTDAPGDYTYETTFNLEGYNLAMTFISGQYVVDNEVVQIYLNGVSTDNAGRLPGNNNTLTPGNFTISSGFNQFGNTLDFVVYNTAGATGNPSGIQIEHMTGTTTVPEPASLGLAGLALAGLAGRRRRPSTR